jgi:hypothetical protein
MRIGLAIACAPAALGMQEPLPDDPKRPVDRIAHDPGIGTEEFVACFANVLPAPRGMAPSPERVHARKILLSCLQKANSAITNEKMDEVMDRCGPGK